MKELKDKVMLLVNEAISNVIDLTEDEGLILYDIREVELVDHLVPMCLGVAIVNAQSETARIEINRRFAETASTDELFDVLAHEVLHCVEHCQNHGRLWKYLVAKFNEIHCTNIEVYSNSVVNGNENVSNGIIDNSNYAGKCNNCGSIFSRTRDSKTVELVRRKKVSCAGCKNGVFEMVKDLSYPDLNYDKLEQAEESFPYVIKCSCDNGNKRYYYSRDTKMVKRIRRGGVKCKACGGTFELIKDKKRGD